MEVAVLEPDHIADGERLGAVPLKQQSSAALERDPNLLGVGMPVRGLTAPGCMVTRVMVTRRDEEFSGNSSCSDCTPELDSVAIEAFRMISIGAPQFCLLLYNPFRSTNQSRKNL